mmetsp:Transcript_8762/g.26340  ORF Transcript_8762/g.26340 Transcript_8762/m.26340 type:complete len:292 (-) Transcript_8762:601-1476(-)
MECQPQRHRRVRDTKQGRTREEALWRSGIVLARLTEIREETGLGVHLRADLLEATERTGASEAGTGLGAGVGMGDRHKKTAERTAVVSAVREPVTTTVTEIVIVTATATVIEAETETMTAKGSVIEKGIGNATITADESVTEVGTGTETATGSEKMTVTRRGLEVRNVDAITTTVHITTTRTTIRCVEKMATIGAAPSATRTREGLSTVTQMIAETRALLTKWRRIAWMTLQTCTLQKRVAQIATMLSITTRETAVTTEIGSIAAETGTTGARTAISRMILGPRTTIIEEN